MLHPELQPDDSKRKTRTKAKKIFKNIGFLNAGKLCRFTCGTGNLFLCAIYNISISFLSFSARTCDYYSTNIY